MRLTFVLDISKQILELIRPPIWDYGKDIETTQHSLLHCQNFTHEFNILSLNGNSFTQTLLFDDKIFIEISNTQLMNSVTEYTLLINFREPWTL